MEKYNQIQRAVQDAKNSVLMPSHFVKDFSTSTYTFDPIVVKKDSVGFPREVTEVLQEGGNVGLVEGMNILWTSSKRRLVLWNFSSSLIHEMDIRSHKIMSVYPIHPKKEVFVGSIHLCLLLFTERDISLMCLCNNPVAFVDMELSAFLPVQMNCVCETHDQRVLLGGVDGNIYEFVYDRTSWFGGRKAKIVCHTSGTLSHLLPFIYAIGKRSAVSQIVPTKQGSLILYEDNMLDSFEYRGRFKRVRTADLSLLNLKSREKVQLLPMNGNGYEACLALGDGRRAFLDGNGVVVGIRKLPPSRTHRANKMTGPQDITTESFFSVSKHLVVLGKKDQEGAVMVISPNRGEETPPENCSTLFVGQAGYIQAVGMALDPIGKPVENQAENLLRGQGIALLSFSKIDIYQILDGLEIMERSSTHPEALFSFRQRSGTEYSFLCSLYAVSLGVSSVSIDNLFRKSSSLHNHYITHCAGIIVSGVWSKNILDVLSENNSMSEGNKYLEEIEQCIDKIEKLKKYVTREVQSLDTLHIQGPFTVLDMLGDVIETLKYIGILLETDAVYVLKETARRMGQDPKTFPATFAFLLTPDSPQRKISLEALIDLHIAQNSSIDTIAGTLNEKCPILFALSDTLLLRGKEAVERALRSTSEEDRKWYLDRSISFFQKTSVVHLSSVVELYVKAKFPAGVLSVLKGGFQSVDRATAARYFSMVEYTEEFLREALKDERPLFCSALLDSVIQQIKADKLSIDILLKAKSSYLEEYLEMLDRTGTDIELCDLVWKYHLKNRNYKTASLYLFRAAERVQPFITLQKRIEYLAIACTMQSASTSQKTPITGPIREFAPRLGTMAKERLDMAQKQADVMSSIAGMYTPGRFSLEEERKIEGIFARLETELLGYEELFDICVMFGFSLLALKISNAGVIEDQLLSKQLWEDTLSGDYEHCLNLLLENKDITSSTTIDLLTEILLKKRLESTSTRNLGEELLLLGFSAVSVARVLEAKASSLEHISPHNKKIILNEAVRFCETQNLINIMNRLLVIKRTLGL
ncbi:nuclear pore complex protein Nup155 [Nematocida sp. AWRm77]|nr:nuclear pore complex protein Nup155 [Nematocida sp. AWRm77]